MFLKFSPTPKKILFVIKNLSKTSVGSFRSSASIGDIKSGLTSYKVILVFSKMLFFNMIYSNCNGRRYECFQNVNR